MLTKIIRQMHLTCLTSVLYYMQAKATREKHMFWSYFKRRQGRRYTQLNEIMFDLELLNFTPAVQVLSESDHNSSVTKVVLWKSPTQDKPDVIIEHNSRPDMSCAFLNQGFNFRR